MAHHRSTHIATLALALVALAVPAAQARTDVPPPAQRVTPDMRVMSSLAGTSSPVDLRSPDGQDAARPVPAQVDLRSPDARDAAHAVGGRGAFVPATTRVARSRGASVHLAGPSNGTDWGDVALIGGAATGLLLIASGAMAATRRRDTARKAETLVGSR